MLNHRELKPQIACNVCNQVQDATRESCIGCGVSFVFGKDGAWKTNSLQQHVDGEPCLYDSVDTATIIGLVCNCPRCSPRYIS